MALHIYYTLVLLGIPLLIKGFNISLEQINPNDTHTVIYPDIATYRLSLCPSSPAANGQVICTWDMDDGTPAFDTNHNDMSSGFVYDLLHTNKYTPGRMLHNIVVSCVDQTPDIVLNYLAINVSMNIHDPYLSVNVTDSSFLETGLNYMFTATADGGEAGARYVVEFGDGFVDVFESDEHENFTLPYVYTFGGIYEVGLTVYDEYHGVQNYWETFVCARVKDIVLTPDTYTALLPTARTDFHIIYTNPDGRIPNNVTCTWSITGDYLPDFTVYYDTLDVGTFENIVFTQNALLPANRTVAVTCWNSLSSETLEVEIQILQGVYNPSLSTDYTDILQVGVDNITFDIVASAGDLEVNYELDTGDNTLLFTKTPHVNFNIIYQYTLPGLYYPKLRVYDVTNDFIYNTTTAVLAEVGIDELLVNTTNTPGMIPDGVVHVSIEGLSQCGVPSAAICTYTLPDMTTVTHSVDFSVQNPFTVAVTLAYVSANLGDVSISVTCHNNVSLVSNNTYFTMHALITGVSLTTPTIIEARYNDITLTLSRLTGSAVTYEVCYGYSTCISPLEGDSVFVNNVLSTTHTTSYDTEGVYNISLLAYNEIQEELVYLDHLIEIERRIESYELEDSSPILLPTGDTTYQITPNVSTNVPRGMHVDWTFGDGTTATEVITPLLHERHYTYSSSSVGKTTTTALLYNNVSQLLLTVDTIVIEEIGVLTLAPDKVIIGTLETFTMSSSLTAGSNVTYSYTWETGVTDVDAWDESTHAVKNINSQFDHAYSTPGNYTITVEALNHFSEQTEQFSQITVQNQVPKLVLNSNSPVLTPPGLVDFTLDKLDINEQDGSDVTCSLTYGDAITADDTYYYFPSFSPTIPYSYVYHPDANTIQGSFESEITCANTVNSEQASTTIDIIPNIISLDTLVESGPAQLNEDVLFILTVDNWAFDPCFSWRFDVLDHTVLFGRDECQVIEAFVFDEFIQIDTPQPTLTYTISFLAETVETLTIHAENSISTDTISVQTLVMPESCNKPEASLGNEGSVITSPRPSYTYQSVSIYGKYSTDCARAHGVRFEWTVLYIVNDTSEVDVGLPQPESALLAIEPFTLAQGLYKIKFTVIMTKLPLEILTETEMFLSIAPSPLEENPIFGEVKNVLYSDPIVISARDLYIDRDVPNEKNNGNGIGNYISPEDDAHMMYSCQMLSDASSPLTTVDWATVAGDYDEGDCPSGSGSVQNGILSIQGGVLDVGETLGISMFVTTGNKTLEFYLTVVAADVEPFQVAVECTANCLHLGNPHSVMVYTATCLDCETDMEYTYQIYMYNTTTELYEQQNISVKTVIEEENIRGTIPPHTLSPGATYRLQFMATDGARVSVVERDFQVNVPPWDGNCYRDNAADYIVWSPEGQAVIICDSWKDDELGDVYTPARRKRAAPVDHITYLTLEYEIYHMQDTENGIRRSLLTRGRDPVSAPILLPFPASDNNFTTMLDIVVIDSIGSSTHSPVNVQAVLPSTNGSSTNGSISFLQMAIDVQTAITSGDVMAALQQVNTILSVLDEGMLEETTLLSQEEAAILIPDEDNTSPRSPTNNTPDPQDQTVLPTIQPDLTSLPPDPSGAPSASKDGEIITMRSYLVEQITKLNPSSPLEISQIAQSVASISDTPEMMTTSPEYLISPPEDETSKELAVSGYIETGLDQMTIATTLSSSLEDVASYTTSEQLKESSMAIVEMTIKAIEAMSQSLNTWVKNCTGKECADITTSETAEKYNNLTRDAEDIFLKMADMLVLNDLTNDEAQVYDMDSFSMSVDKMTGEGAMEATMANTRGEFSFPKLTRVLPDNCSTVALMAFDTNMFTFDSSSQDINTPVLQILTKYCDAPEKFTPTDSVEKDPFGMSSNLPDAVSNVPGPRNGKKRSSRKRRSVSPQAFEWQFTVLNDSVNDMALHSVNKSNKNSNIQMYIDPPIRGMHFKIYISHNAIPSTSAHDFHLSVPGDLPTNLPTNQEEYDIVFEPYGDGYYTVVVPKNQTELLGTYTIGVVAYGQVDGERIKSANYSFHVTEVTCLIYDEGTRSWKSDGCQVTNESTPKKARFTSKVFPSSFGAGLIMKPNTIDFGSVFENAGAKLLENIHVLLVIIIMWLLWFAILPYARRKDKQDSLKWLALPVYGVDTRSCTYHYDVQLYTGLGPGSGTESRVYITIVGVDADSGALQLVDGVRKNFKRGDMNRFIVSVPAPLGNLRFLRVYHDNSGEGDKAGWFLEKVLIRDLQQRKRFLFICDQWLAVDRGDFKIDCVLKVATKQHITKFKEMLVRRTKKHFVDDHLWISTFIRQNEDAYTRVQRITTAVAFVFMTMIANAMWYGVADSNEQQDGIQIGPINLTLQTVMTSIYSLLTCLPVTIILVVLFTKSKVKQNKTDDSIYEQQAETWRMLNCYEQDKLQTPPESPSDTTAPVPIPEKQKTKKPLPDRFLPHFFIYVAWTLAVLCILASSFFTVLYSMEWGGEKSKAWLTAFILCFGESEVLVAPIKAMILALLLSFLCKRPVDEVEDVVDDDEIMYGIENDGQNVDKLEEAKNRRLLEVLLSNAVKSFIWHFLFIICLLLVCFGNRDSDMYRTNEEIKNIMHGKLDLVTTKSQWWQWLNTHALPSIYKTHLYNGQALVGKDLNFIDDSLYMRLGPPYLRQYRVMEDRCKAHRMPIPVDCNVDFSSKHENSGTYWQGWAFTPPVSNITNITEPELSTSPPMWEQAYNYRHDLNSETSYWAVFKTYSGGGYSVPLGIHLEEAQNTSHNLQQQQWIDRYTRAVVLELNLYNAHTNLFCLASIMMEFPSFGGTEIFSEIKTIRMYRYIGSWGFFALISEVILFIFLFVLFIKICINIKREKRKYMSSFWNKLECIKVFLGLSSLGLYIYRTVLIKNTMEDLMNNIGKLVSFKPVVLVDEVFIYLIGFACFVQILQFLWVFKFNRHFAVFSATLHHGKSTIRDFCIAMSIIFTAFTMWAFLAHQTRLRDYRDYLYSSYAQMVMMLGAFKTGSIAESAGDLGLLMFLAYQIIMMYIFLNVLIVIIMDTYSEACQGKFDLGDECRAFEYMRSKRKKNNQTDFNREMSIMQSNHGKDKDPTEATSVYGRRKTIFIASVNEGTETKQSMGHGNVNERSSIDEDGFNGHLRQNEISKDMNDEIANPQFVKDSDTVDTSVSNLDDILKIDSEDEMNNAYRPQGNDRPKSFNQVFPSIPKTPTLYNGDKSHQLDNF